MHRFALALLLVSISTSKIIWMGDIANPGARYPINDVYDGKDQKPRQGQLNSVGMRQQYLLGNYLRADYIDNLSLINPKYMPSTMEVFACGSIDRTYDSALSRLYGLYPTQTGWKIPEEVDISRLEPPFAANQRLKSRADLPFALENGFQPIPIWPLDDYLNDACPNAEAIKAKRLQEVASTLANFEKEQSTFYAKMKSVFNLSAVATNTSTMADLYDTLMSDLTLGKTLPKSFDATDMKNLKYVSDYYTMLVNDGSYAQTFSTLTLELLRIKLEAARTRKIGDKKWSMFFPKEGTIAPLLSILNMTSTSCLTKQWKNQTVTELNCVQPPKFSTNMLLELHEDDSFQYFVRIKYNGVYVAMCGTSTTICEYRDFMSRLSINTSQYNQTCYGK